MSEVNFSNESWQWEHDNETACTISVFNFNGVEICRLQSETNANLIAAAPAMYAMLERAKEVMLYTYDVTDYPADGNTDCDICASEIDALLAKARGE